MHRSGPGPSKWSSRSSFYSQNAIGIAQFRTWSVQVELLELLAAKALGCSPRLDMSSRSSFYSQNVIENAQIRTRTVQAELQELIVFTKCNWKCIDPDQDRPSGAPGAHFIHKMLLELCNSGPGPSKWSSWSGWSRRPSGVPQNWK